MLTDSLMKKRLKYLAIFTVLPTVSRHVSKQMFNKVKIAAYREIFSAIPIKDRPEINLAVTILYNGMLVSRSRIVMVRETSVTEATLIRA